jgi:aminoglycoside phosphotransferase (APT) family kinase protein
VYANAASVAHLTESDARAASFELIDVLARLHAVDPAVVGLADLGRPDGYLERQLARWRKQWDLSKQRELSEIDELSRRLDAALPASSRAAIVHGDYSFNNTMWRAHEPDRMVAVLDWEMATQGDPLADLGMVLAYWGDVGARMWRDRGTQPHRANPGFASADDLVARYEASSGRDLEHLDFYIVLAAYKLAVIAEGARARLGATDPEGARRTNQTVADIATLTLEIADGSSVAALRGTR